MFVIPIIYTYVFMLGIFIYAGASDWIRREVDDLVSIAAWGLCWLGGFDLNILVGTFIGFWLLSEVASYLENRNRKEKIQVFGWADVLMVPPFMATVASFYSYEFAAILLCAILIAVWWSKKKSVPAPMVSLLALGMLIAAGVRMFFSS